MTFFAIIILAVGLSVDSFAASVSTGICLKKVKITDSLKVAIYMAIFQGTFPIFGWLIGKGFHQIIMDYDHWIAFILLSSIGGKMIYEGLSKKDIQNSCFCPSNHLLLAGMAFATSIDALIVGVGIGILGDSIWLPATIIGITTFIFSITGIYLGHHLGHKLNIKLEVVGGLVLTGLGIKILFEHTIFN
jgi:putative Mn2+ efflux pump MntP